MATGLPIVPAQQNFSVQRGSAGAYALISAQVKNPDGSLVDLTGAIVEIVTSINGLSVSTSDGSLTVDLPTSTFFWYPTSTQTEAVPYGRVTKYRVWITFPGGSKGPYLEGFLNGDGAIGSQPASTIVLQGPQGIQGPAGTGGETAYPIIVMQAGQTQIPLSIPPAILSQVAVIVNGVEYRPPYISASSIAVIWAGPFSLDPSDTVFVRY